MRYLLAMAALLASVSHGETRTRFEQLSRQLGAGRAVTVPNKSGDKPKYLIMISDFSEIAAECVSADQPNTSVIKTISGRAPDPNHEFFPQFMVTLAGKTVRLDQIKLHSGLAHGRNLGARFVSNGLGYFALREVGVDEDAEQFILARIQHFSDLPTELCLFQGS